MAAPLTRVTLGACGWCGHSWTRDHSRAPGEPVPCKSCPNGLCDRPRLTPRSTP